MAGEDKAVRKAFRAYQRSGSRRAAQVLLGPSTGVQIRRGAGRGVINIGANPHLGKEGITIGRRGGGGFIAARTQLGGGYGVSKSVGTMSHSHLGGDWDVHIHWATISRLYLIEKIGQFAVEYAAKRVTERARSMAPVDTGAYRASIQWEYLGQKLGVIPTAAVFSTDFKANWIEFGTGGSTPTPAFAPLRRSVEGAAQGLRGALK